MENNSVLKQIVMNNNLASISHAIAGVLYYEVKTPDATYQFPVDILNLQDVGTATFPAQIKAITLMRYIRKAIKNEELVKF
jgi:hypothetical protein